MILGLSLAFAAAPRGVESGLATPGGLDRAYASRRVALLVGIDAYTDPALGNLAYAAKDAADIASVLRDPTLGGYDVVAVVAGEVTRASFWDSFDALASTIQRDDTVVVYVAGHGTLELGQDGAELFLLGSDAWLARAVETGIPVRDLAARVSALPARRTVMVLDACYSGSGRSVLAPEVERKLRMLRGPVPAPAALVVSEFSAHLYAAHLHQPSIEDPALANGVYTHFLVEALRGAGDRDGDGLVEVMEAHGWARDRTLEYTGGTQVPWAETVSVGREAVYLTGDAESRKAVEHALLTGLEGLPRSAVITVDGLTRGGGPLAEGRRRIEVRTADRPLLVISPVVHPGRDVDLGERIARRQARLAVAVAAVGATDPGWLGAAGVGVGVGLAPPDPGGGRPELWVAGSVRTGPPREPGRGFPAGTGTLGASWLFPASALELGPSLGAGFAWRLPAEPGPEASPMIQPGLRVRVGERALYGELSLDGPLFLGNHRLVVLPSAAVGIGLRPIRRGR